jgi:uncharacterized membrane protein YfcA
MRSLIFGIIMIIGGASGKLVLIGTNSSTALVVVGVVVTAIGVFQMMSSKKSASENAAPSAQSTGIRK